MDQGDSSGDIEKLSESRYILKANPTSFVDNLIWILRERQELRMIARA